MPNTLVKKTLEEFYDSIFINSEDNINNIQPIFNKQGICVSCSDFYAKYLSILLLSIIEHSTPKNKYDIIVFTTDMSIETKHILETLTNQKNIKIRIFNINEKIKKYQFYTWAHFTPNTYYRLSIPELLKNYDKILYLDSDTVVNTDIAQIFNINLNDNYIAAAKDSHVLSYCNGVNLEQLEYNKNILKLKKPQEYFQMGVSLFNIKKFNTDYTDNLLEIASKVQYRWLDQDILNVEFQGEIKELSIDWNVMILNKPPYLDEYYLPQRYREQYCKARFSPKIIHYCGGVYYRFPFLPDLGRFFWKYAIKSPFFEDIITQMINLKLPTNNLQNKEIEYLRREFTNMHFPNINNHFAANEYNTKLLFVIEHPMRFKLKKSWYAIKKAFAFGKRYQKYQQKYQSLKTLLKDAKKLKKSFLNI